MSFEKKARGKYYTPLQLADAMVKFFVSDNTKKILEPSCGKGVFLDSMDKKGLLGNVEKFTAVEVNAKTIEKAKNKYKFVKNIEFINDDFFNFYNQNKENNKYDLIIGNPPYIKYQLLSSFQRQTLSSILVSHGMKANKLINMWVGFLVACTHMLNSTGRIVFVIPAELLQVNYAKDLRCFLLKQFKNITLITFKKLVFPQVSQEVMVFVGEKDGDKKGVKVIELGDLDDFSSLDLKSENYQPIQNAKEKWTRFFISSEENRIINHIKNDAKFLPFSAFGTINVGVTTGNDKYFSIDKEVCEKYKLKETTLPLVGKNSHIHGAYFTKSDWEKNVKRGERAKLITFPSKPLAKYPKEHQEYVELGEKNKVHRGYKCFIREQWYVVPSVWIPDAFFPKFNYLYPKLAINKCEAISISSVNRIKLNDDIDTDTLLLSYYNSISFVFTEICGRSYGKGVLSISPGEIRNIMLPVLKDFPKNKKRELVQKIDIAIRENKDIEIILDLIDREVLVKYLGLDIQLCISCRTAWKKLQQRRIGRRL